MSDAWLWTRERPGGGGAPPLGRVLQHPRNGTQGACAHRRVHFHFVLDFLQRRQDFGSVMVFMCGQRLQGRTKSTSGNSTATLSLMEHSVIMTTREGLSSST